ncbi:hypothetical protein HSE3_gp104 [Bacillus phage vB_BceM-HSE3]|nr:hypothetical protein HSE3_gp104 [Bacillus phage vB_BceM-HSE3]
MESRLAVVILPTGNMDIVKLIKKLGNQYLVEVTIDREVLKLEGHTRIVPITKSILIEEFRLINILPSSIEIVNELIDDKHYEVYNLDNNKGRYMTIEELSKLTDAF